MRKLGLAVGDPGVVRDSTGRATGQVIGAADARARRAIGAELATLTLDEQESCTKHFIRELNRRGLTAWDDPGPNSVVPGRQPAAPRRRAERADPAQLRAHGRPGQRGRRRAAADRRRRPRRAGDRRPGRLPAGRSTGRILRQIAGSEWAFEHGATRATTQHGLVAAVGAGQPAPPDHRPALADAASGRGADRAEPRRAGAPAGAQRGRRPDRRGRHGRPLAPAVPADLRERDRGVPGLGRARRRAVPAVREPLVHDQRPRRTTRIAAASPRISCSRASRRSRWRPRAATGS